MQWALQLHQVSSKSDEKLKRFINSLFFCSKFQSVSRIVKIIHSARGGGGAFVKQKVYNLEMHMHSMMQCWWVITFRRLWTKSFLA